MCLASEGHPLLVGLAVAPPNGGPFVLQRGEVGEVQRKVHADSRAATKEGAEGVARLLVRAQLGLLVTEASDQGTGFDYWLGGEADDTNLFLRRKRLEVSGVLPTAPTNR